MAKKIDPKAKAKRQKVIAGIGGVLLLGLLAFQVPRTLKMLHPPDQSASSTTPAATTPSTGTSIAAPSLSGGNAVAAVSAGGDGLSDPDALPAAQSGQLLAFGLFRTKDPFAQQLKAGTTGPGGPAPVSGASSGPTGSAGPKTSTSGGSSPTLTVAHTSAVISVDGHSQSVSVGGQFPSSDPVFTLVSLTAKTARVGIAGGSLENGHPTVTLKRNQPMTLLNTADGTRYVLRLISVG
jgi:hypothetical protein